MLETINTEDCRAMGWSNLLPRVIRLKYVAFNCSCWNSMKCNADHIPCVGTVLFPPNQNIGIHAVQSYNNIKGNFTVCSTYRLTG